MLCTQSATATHAGTTAFVGALRTHSNQPHSPPDAASTTCIGPILRPPNTSSLTPTKVLTTVSKLFHSLQQLLLTLTRHYQPQLLQCHALQAQTEEAWVLNSQNSNTVQYKLRTQQIQWFHPPQAARSNTIAAQHMVCASDAASRPCSTTNGLHVCQMLQQKSRSTAHTTRLSLATQSDPAAQGIFACPMLHQKNLKIAADKSRGPKLCRRATMPVCIGVLQYAKRAAQ